MADADNYPSIQLKNPSDTWANDALRQPDVLLINTNLKALNDADKQLETNYENAEINKFLTYYLDNLNPTSPSLNLYGGGKKHLERKNDTTSSRAKENLYYLFNKGQDGNALNGANFTPLDATGFYSNDSHIKERAKKKLMELLCTSGTANEDETGKVIQAPSSPTNTIKIQTAIATLEAEKQALANSDTSIQKEKKQRYRKIQKAVNSLETNSPSTSDKLKKATNYQEVIEKLNNNRPRRNWIDKFSSSAEKKSFRLKTTKTQGNLEEATFNRVKNKKTTIKITCAKTIWNANTGGYDVADQFGRDHSRVSKELENLSIHDIEKILNELKNDPSFDHNGLKLKYCSDGSVEWSLKINKGMSKFLTKAREASTANTEALEASREKKHAQADTNNIDDAKVRDNSLGM